MTGFNWTTELSPPTQEKLLTSARKLSLPDGNTIYREGDEVTDVFQIVSGQIRKCMITEDGQEVLIYVYGAGDFLGDSSAGDEDPYSVTIVTRGKTELRAWSTRHFAELRATFPELEAAVSRQTNKRLRYVLRLLSDLLTKPAPVRIASRLLWLCEMQPESANDIDLDTSQADIGLMVGSSRQTVNQVLTDLRNRDVLQTDYGRIVVKNVAELRAYIQEKTRQNK